MYDLNCIKWMKSTLNSVNWPDNAIPIVFTSKTYLSLRPFLMNSVSNFTNIALASSILKRAAVHKSTVENTKNRYWNQFSVAKTLQFHL